MALLRRGITDINTEDPKLINRAVTDLKQLYSICNIKVGDSQYQTIPEGTAWLNQAWSGDPISGYIYYLPKSTPAKVLSYWKAPKGHVPGAERLLVDLLRPPRSRCWRTCGSTTSSTTASPISNFSQLQRLPAAAERDRARQL